MRLLIATMLVVLPAAPAAAAVLASSLPMIPGLPEPSSWAMLLTGFGLTGALARRRRRRIQVSA